MQRAPLTFQNGIFKISYIILKIHHSVQTSPVSFRPFRDEEGPSHSSEDAFVLHLLHLVSRQTFRGQRAFYAMSCLPSCLG